MNQPQQRPILHYALTPQAYNLVLDVLGQLPYNQVAPVLRTLAEGTAPIYADVPKDPNSGEIVDNPGGTEPEAEPEGDPIDPAA